MRGRLFLAIAIVAATAAAVVPARASSGRIFTAEPIGRQQVSPNAKTGWPGDPPGPTDFAPCGDPFACQFTTRAIRRLDGQNSSARSGDGTGTVPLNIAILDSGTQRSTELNVVGGKDCVHDGRGALADPEGHGTIIGGLIGARDNGKFIVGIAPGARLWSVRVLDENLEAEDANILCGLRWVLGTHRDSNPANDIAVVNMSLGGPGKDDGQCGRADRDAVHAAICALADAGIVVVAGAGNDRRRIEGFVPAAYSEVLTVSGMTDSDGTWGRVGGPDLCEKYPDDRWTPFSNFATTSAGAAHIVAAPAVCNSSVFPSDNPPTPELAVDSGTSYAAPLGTGVVALCIWSKACAGLGARQIVTKIVTDAFANTAQYPYFGFKGDPFNSVPDRHYGPVLRASLY